jgi:hypothetical protein
MPNLIKYSTSAQTLALKSGDYWIGTGDVPKGPTSSSDYWNGITPPSGGYTIYLNKASQGPSIYTPLSDSDLIVTTNMIAQTSFTTTTECFNWFNTQSDKMVFNIDYPPITTNGLILNVDAGFRPSYSTSGVTWYDTSPNGNNMTLTNGPTYSSTGGGTIVFDGTDDYTQSTMSVNSIVNVTIECWVNISSTSNKGAFVKVGGGVNGYSIGVGGNTMDTLGNEVIGLFPGIRWIDTNQTYGTGWKMVNLVLNASSVPSIYLNGTLLNSYSGANPVTPTAGVYIGRTIGDEPSGARAFSGNISKVRIYNRALSSAEILQNFYGSNIVTSGLVLYLDAGNIVSYPQTGTAWYDISGNNQNFTLYNSPTFSNSNGGEILFSNSNDYARITNSTSIDLLASNGTIEVWFRTISSTLGGTYARLISFSDASGTGSDSSSTQGLNRDYDNYLCLVKNNTAESLGLWYKNNPSAFGPATLVNTNTYFHSVISWSTNGSLMTFTFYLNGVSTNTSTVTQSAYSSNASTITIGQNCAGALTNPYENSSCAFSSLKLYNRALTAQEVSQNYNAQKSRFGL